MMSTFSHSQWLWSQCSDSHLVGLFGENVEVHLGEGGVRAGVVLPLEAGRLRVHLEAGVVHTCELTVSVLTLADDGRGQVQTDAHRNNNSAAAGPGLASTELGPGSFADCVYVNIWMSYCNTALKCCILDILCKAGIRFQVQCVHTTPGLIAALLRSCH